MPSKKLIVAVDFSSSTTSGRGLMLNGEPVDYYELVEKIVSWHTANQDMEIVYITWHGSTSLVTKGEFETRLRNKTFGYGTNIRFLADFLVTGYPASEDMDLLLITDGCVGIPDAVRAQEILEGKRFSNVICYIIETMTSILDVSVVSPFVSHSAHEIRLFHKGIDHYEVVESLPLSPEAIGRMTEGMWHPAEVIASGPAIIGGAISGTRSRPATEVYLPQVERLTEVRRRMEALPRDTEVDQALRVLDSAIAISSGVIAPSFDPSAARAMTEAAMAGPAPHMEEHHQTEDKAGDKTETEGST
jgi:hypothetical protein